MREADNHSTRERLRVGGYLAKLIRMKVINMHAAKSQLSQLVEAAERGDDIVIARAGRPAVRLVPIEALPARTLGAWKGRVSLGEDFDAPLPSEIAAAFGNEP